MVLLVVASQMMRGQAPQIFLFLTAPWSILDPENDVKVR